jgi:hypothetical protein
MSNTAIENLEIELHNRGLRPTLTLIFQAAASGSPLNIESIELGSTLDRAVAALYDDDLVVTAGEDHMVLLPSTRSQAIWDLSFPNGDREPRDAFEASLVLV